MRSKLTIVFCLLIVLLLTFSIVFQHKIYKNFLHLKRTSQQQSIMSEHFIGMLNVYSSYDENGPLELKRWGKKNDGGYVVPVKVLELSDVLMGYGIDKDNSFEDSFSLEYNKLSYGFDCGIDGIESESNLFTFVDECISSDNFIYDKSQTSGKISSFPQQLESLKLQNKEVFIKMDIEGAEYNAFHDILPYHNQITGIVLEIHIADRSMLPKALELLVALEKHFLLVHIHGNNCCLSTGFYTANAVGKVPSVVELTYINKKLVAEYELSKNSSYPLKIDMPNIPNRPDASFKILRDSKYLNKVYN